MVRNSNLSSCISRYPPSISHWNHTQSKRMVGKNHYHWTYYTNATKTWLVVKDAHLAFATSAFLGTNVTITSEGRPHLGAPLGTETYVAQSIQKKVAKWCLHCRPYVQLQSLNHMRSLQPSLTVWFTNGLTLPGLFQT